MQKVKSFESLTGRLSEIEIHVEIETTYMEKKERKESIRIEDSKKKKQK